MSSCPLIPAKQATELELVQLAQETVGQTGRPSLIWLEATGCSGNIISLLNAEGPSVIQLLSEIVTMRYNNSLMAAEGEYAFEQFLATLDTEFILVVEGAVAQRDQGYYNVLARHNDRLVTALEAVQMAGAKAQYVVAVGTCASHGGISAARPNPSQSQSVHEVLDRPVINVPGCPSHPDWAIGTIAHLVALGAPELDALNRPLIFYGVTIHDRCPRRSFFDQGIFARNLGEPTCMFKLGCRGPVTRTDCPTRQWNGYVNWPIGDNTPCIGCARNGFPDAMEPCVSTRQEREA
ncbi:MAG: hydrogenase small subunit [Bacillota bacterium]